MKKWHIHSGIGMALLLVLIFIISSAAARNLWFNPNEDRGSFQLKLLRAMELRAPQAPNSPALTIYDHTTSGTITNGATTNGGTFASPTITSPTISAPSLTGTVTFANNTPIAVNEVTNQKLAIWTGGTSRYGSDTSSAPDGYEICTQGSTTGLTRYGQSDSQLIATGATPYGNLGYAMYVQSMGATHGVPAEIAYNSGVSNQPWYYHKYRGKQIQWGAMVYTDPGTTGATDFIRPYIVTATNARGTAGITAFATYSSDYAGGGWEFISAVTTVPNNATALEVGFEVVATTGLTGASAFILGPVLISGNTVNATPNPNPNEQIFFTKTLDPFGSGGSTFGTGTGGSLDLSSDNGWGGKIPDDVAQLYVQVGVNASYPYALHFYGDNAVGGVSFYGLQSGVSPNFQTAWLPVDAGGEINVSDPGANFTGVSFFPIAAIVR